VSWTSEDALGVKFVDSPEEIDGMYGEAIIKQGLKSSE